MNDEIEISHPLTGSQQGVLFHALAGRATGSFSEQFTVTLRAAHPGALDARALRRAWQHLVDTTPALRAGVRDGVEEPLGVVVARCEVPWSQETWDADDPVRLAEFREAELATEFDLARPPLLRVALLSLPGGMHRMVCTVHRLVIDGRSVGMLLTDLAAAYRAILADQAPPEVRRRPFTDYVAWAAGQNTTAAKEFWRTRLSGPAEPTPLGFDHGVSRSRHVESHGEVEIRPALPGLSGLGERATRAGVTLSTVLEAAWALLLARYSGRDEVIFGVMASGRSIPLHGVDTMIGMFVGVVPRRIAVPTDARTVWEWLTESQPQETGRSPHETVSLEAIEEWIDADGPLFDSVLVLEDHPASPDTPDWGDGLAAEGVHRTGGRAGWPITLHVVPGDEPTFRAVYDERRFDRADVEATLLRWARVVAAFADGSPAPADISVIDAADRDRLLRDAGSGPAGTPETTVSLRFAAQVARTPDAVAATDGRATTSYRELWRRASALATMIEERQNDR